MPSLCSFSSFCTVFAFRWGGTMLALGDGMTANSGQMIEINAVIIEVGAKIVVKVVLSRKSEPKCKHG
jgi:hypothetical protein